MSNIASKLSRIRTAKLDIKEAIEDKGVDMTNVDFEDYASKIELISGGGFEDAWNASINYKEIYFDEDLTYLTTDTSLGMPLSIYTGAGIDDLYDLLASKENDFLEYVGIYVNGDGFISDETTWELGNSFRFVYDVSGAYQLPTPVYAFVNELNDPLFVVVDFSKLGMPLGKSIAFINNTDVSHLKLVSGYNTYENIQNGVIIPREFDYIPNEFLAGNRLMHGDDRENFIKSNNLPLIIPYGVETIGWEAFSGWTSNNQLLVIPNSVETIGEVAFKGWTSNNQPLVIPSSVTDIELGAFNDWINVPYIIVKAATPPTIGAQVFDNQNNAPIYVPDESVEDYEGQWYAYSSRIKPISEFQDIVEND